MSSADTRIDKFLAAHPDGPLTICVGYASISGIAWLAERASGRPVTLLIGNLQKRNFKKATDRNRSLATDFVKRSDVKVRNWRRTAKAAEGRSDAHLKVWVAQQDDSTPVAFLVGSANLTYAGLSGNVELMVLADASDHRYIWDVLHGLLAKAKDGRKRLLELISEADDAFPVSTDKPKPTPKPKRSARQRRQGREQTLRGI